MNGKKLVVACLAMTVACLGASALAQNQYSMDYWGFTYMETDILFGLGFVDDIQPPLIVDLENYQYTWLMEDLVLVDYYVEDEVEHYSFAGGTFSVYEDTTRPWNAVYDDQWCPPPYDSTYISEPWTFQDGELFLLGEIRYLNLNYYIQYQFGDYEGLMDLTGGTHLGDIPPELRYGWTFGGTTDLPWACIPDDYEHRWDGQLFLIQDPTLRQPTSWTRIKSIFR